MKNKKNYLNKNICKRCGGICCKKMPGACLPDDFGEPLLENLTQAFRSGFYAVDWWEGDPTGKDMFAYGYFVRPKVKGENKIYSPSWGGECIFLKTTGCELKPEDRPANCRLLEPKEDENGELKCELHEINKKLVAIAWIPFHNIIHEATGEQE